MVKQFFIKQLEAPYFSAGRMSHLKITQFSMTSNPLEEQYKKEKTKLKKTTGKYILGLFGCGLLVGTVYSLYIFKEQPFNIYKIASLFAINTGLATLTIFKLYQSKFKESEIDQKYNMIRQL